MSNWLRLSRADILAALACVVLVAGFSWLGWVALPNRDRAASSTEATVLSISHHFPAGKSGSQASVSLRIRSDDGSEIGINRPMRCQPPVKTGDRVRLVGVPRKAGGMIWSIVGEPCPV